LRGSLEVFATLWGDNGGEASLFTGLLGMQLFAEHGYCRNPDLPQVKRRFRACTGSDADCFLELNAFDEVPGVERNNPSATNPSKFLLWQDVLLGLFDNNVEGLELTAHYLQLRDRMLLSASKDDDYKTLYLHYASLADVLALKWNMGIRLKNHYDSNQKDKLGELVNDLEHLHAKSMKLRESHRLIWLTSCKPFSWEVLDSRYGGMLARIDTAKQRLTDYLEGLISHIAELEEDRLYFQYRQPRREGSLGWTNVYERIVTACDF
jgi:hexosaminidase